MHIITNTSERWNALQMNHELTFMLSMYSFYFSIMSCSEPSEDVDLSSFQRLKCSDSTFDLPARYQTDNKENLFCLTVCKHFPLIIRCCVLLEESWRGWWQLRPWFLIDMFLITDRPTTTSQTHSGIRCLQNAAARVQDDSCFYFAVCGAGLPGKISLVGGGGCVCGGVQF